MTTELGEDGLQALNRDNPWQQLTPEGALNDSPAFRAALQQVEDELEGAGRWLDAFVKNLRSALELSLSMPFVCFVCKLSIV